MDSDSSNLFMPLQGAEHITRLKERFEYDSDLSDCNDDDVGLGKVSQWNPDISSQWLNSHSPTKRKSGDFGCKGGKHQKRSYNKAMKTSEASSVNSFKETQYNDSDKSEALVDQKRHKPKLEETLCVPSTSKQDPTTLLNTEKVFNSTTYSFPDEGGFWEGISIEATEKPKLSVPPISPKMNFKLDDQCVIPASINQYLRDYQRQGIQFLYQHYTNKSGAILADDMGLGKTIQVIGFLSAVLCKQGNKYDTIKMIPDFIKRMSENLPKNVPKRDCKPFLIIGPSAVLYNWLDELNTWGYFIVRKFHGSDKEDCLSDLKKGKPEIVVTTFETYRDNVVILNKLQWEAVIVDEVHKIKGLKSQVTQKLKVINTLCRFGLTGTALQNNLTELWSLLDWAQPGVLGDLSQFEDEYIDVIELGQRQDATKRELARARRQKDKFAKIRKTLMLRRTKALIAHQLPTKEDMVVLCKLTDIQVSIYKAIITHPDMNLILQSDQPCDCRSGKQRASCCYKKASDGTKISSRIFSFMHLLLKAANHIALLIPDHRKLSEKQAVLAKSVCEIAFKDHPQFIEQSSKAAFRTLSDSKFCGKMKILKGLLSVFEQNHDKVLIFSYSTRLLDILEQHIIGQGHEYRRIDGKVSSLNRRNIVKQFNSDPNIFLCLISTKAGGLGLNMTAANRVIIFDPNWNPSHDLQAQDRAYRLGQCRDVQVFRLVSAGTIEENIYLRQIYKQQLDEVVIGTGNARRYFFGVQGSKENPGELFGIKNMFKLRPENSSLTLDVFKRNEKIEKALAGYDISNYIPSKEELFSSQQTDDLPDNSDLEDHSENSELDIQIIESDVEEKEEELFFKNLFWSRAEKVNNLHEVFCHVIANASSFDNLLKMFSSFQPHTKQRCILGLDMNSIPTKSNVPETEAESAAKHEEISVSKDSDEDFCLIPRIHGTKLQKPALGKGNKSLIESPAVWDHNDRRCGLTSEQGLEASDSTINDNDIRNEVQIKQNIKTGRKPASGKSRSKISKESINSDSQSGTSREESYKFTSIKSVFRMKGVLHTLKNSKVVGSSRAEDHMTRCAIEDVYQKHINSQVPADQCEPYSQQDEVMTKRKQRKGQKVKDTTADVNSKRTIRKEQFTIMVGQTPRAILKQHWSDLCKFRSTDSKELARKLIQSTVQERLQMLKEFYKQQFPELVDTVEEIYKSDKNMNANPGKNEEKAKSQLKDCSASNSEQDLPDLLLNASTLATDFESDNFKGESFTTKSKLKSNTNSKLEKTKALCHKSNQDTSSISNIPSGSTELQIFEDSYQAREKPHIVIDKVHTKVMVEKSLKVSLMTKCETKTVTKQKPKFAKVLDDIFQSSSEESVSNLNLDENFDLSDHLTAGNCKGDEVPTQSVNNSFDCQDKQFKQDPGKTKLTVAVASSIYQKIDKIKGVCEKSTKGSVQMVTKSKQNKATTSSPAKQKRNYARVLDEIFNSSSDEADFTDQPSPPRSGFNASLGEVVQAESSFVNNSLVSLDFLRGSTLKPESNGEFSKANKGKKISDTRTASVKAQIDSGRDNLEDNVTLVPFNASDSLF